MATAALFAAGTEREVSQRWSTSTCEELVRKVSGVSEQEARHRRVPSKTTLAGLVSSMTRVERGCFQPVLAGRPRPRPVPTAAAASDSSELADDETVASLVAEYRRACEESRQTAARFALDDTVPQRRLDQVSLRGSTTT